MAADEALRVTCLIAELLENLGIEYLVGGSLASSVHGIPRSTQDVDIVANLRPVHIKSLEAALGADFYFDADRIREVVEHGGCFNVIHLATMIKIDIFTLDQAAPFREEMDRRIQVEVATDPLQKLWIATAEDIVVHKLRWYRLGGNVSDRQWNDILGVLRVSSSRSLLDAAYMRRQAMALGVLDLLGRALDEAELGRSR